jgi:hypothetical protein
MLSGRTYLSRQLRVILWRVASRGGKKAGSLGFRLGMGPIHNEVGSSDTELEIWKFWLYHSEIMA